MMSRGGLFLFRRGARGGGSSRHRGGLCCTILEKKENVSREKQDRRRLRGETDLILFHKFVNQT